MGFFYVCLCGTYFHDVLCKPSSEVDPDVVFIVYIYRACVGHFYCALAVSFAYIIMLYACAWAVVVCIIYVLVA